MEQLAASTAEKKQTPTQQLAEAIYKSHSLEFVSRIFVDLDVNDKESCLKAWEQLQVAMHEDFFTKDGRDQDGNRDGKGGVMQQWLRANNYAVCRAVLGSKESNFNPTKYQFKIFAVYKKIVNEAVKLQLGDDDYKAYMGNITSEIFQPEQELNLSVEELYIEAYKEFILCKVNAYEKSSKSTVTIDRLSNGFLVDGVMGVDGVKLGDGRLYNKHKNKLEHYGHLRECRYKYKLPPGILGHIKTLSIYLSGNINNLKTESISKRFFKWKADFECFLKAYAKAIIADKKVYAVLQKFIDNEEKIVSDISADLDKMFFTKVEEPFKLYTDKHSIISDLIFTLLNAYNNPNFISFTIDKINMSFIVELERLLSFTGRKIKGDNSDKEQYNKILEQLYQDTCYLGNFGLFLQSENLMVMGVYVQCVYLLYQAEQKKQSISKKDLSILEKIKVNIETNSVTVDYNGKGHIFSDIENLQTEENLVPLLKGLSVDTLKNMPLSDESKEKIFCDKAKKAKTRSRLSFGGTFFISGWIAAAIVLSLPTFGLSLIIAPAAIGLISLAYSIKKKFEANSWKAEAKFITAKNEATGTKEVDVDNAEMKGTDNSGVGTNDILIPIGGAKKSTQAVGMLNLLIEAEQETGILTPPPSPRQPPSSENSDSNRCSDKVESGAQPLPPPIISKG